MAPGSSDAMRPDARRELCKCHARFSRDAIEVETRLILRALMQINRRVTRREVRPACKLDALIRSRIVLSQNYFLVRRCPLADASAFYLFKLVELQLSSQGLQIIKRVDIIQSVSMVGLR